ncbi:hypothetical protein LshimejAT787_1301580 [Lyophyllum shimeji]|uniref:Rhodopsin domain-containing protein n=1 Tax=Lyophyllum shimeji TaxID=47721 RepID=A0A9P3USI5_LYOSH|nr:hypothetical protein LshimejAT787_1301580 [Lyophyllum shimeji]
MLLELTLHTWRAVVTPLHALAIGCTIFRLWHRYRIRQLWWDDYWATISLFFDVVYTSTPFLRYDISDPRPTKEMRIMIYWLTALIFPPGTWSARISIGMSIARIVPSQTHTRHMLYAMNGLFGSMCIGQMLHKIVICTRDTSWHNNAAVQCYLGSGVGVLSLCTDLTADACLVTIPLRMLWRVKLPRTQRRLILSIFASSFVSSLVGIVYTVFVFQKQKGGQVWGYWIGLIAGIKAAVTLLVCNLLVIVMFLYRIFWKDEADTVSEPSETRSKPTHPLPTTSTFIIPRPTILSLTEISNTQRIGTATHLSEPLTVVQSTPCRGSLPLAPSNRCVSM